MKAFQLKRNYSAPNTKSGSAKAFNRGDIVQGAIYDNKKIEGLEDELATSVITESGHLIPLDYLQEQKEDSKVVVVKKNEKMLDVKSLKPELLLPSTKYGAIIGAVVGLVIANTFKRNYVMWGGLGLICGAYVGSRMAEAQISVTKEK